MKPLHFFYFLSFLMGACHTQIPMSSVDSSTPASSFVQDKPILQISKNKEKNLQSLDSILSESAVFSTHFTGFSLFDIEENKIVFEQHSQKYFTPASLVKTLTLFATLQSFQDKLPDFLYQKIQDTLYLQPIGNPLFLHSDFSSQQAFSFLDSTTSTLAIQWPDFPLNPYGKGWMWDDYNTKYQPERSWMPLYGNVVQFDYQNENLQISPNYFKKGVKIVENNHSIYKIKRHFGDNIFEVNKEKMTRIHQYTLPFKTDSELSIDLLADTLKKEVFLSQNSIALSDTLFTHDLDTVLKKMMQESNNFLAEQLLIMCAWKNGFHDIHAFIDFALTNWLSAIQPLWVDGSGLSRYNMLKPHDMIVLFKKLYDEVGWEKIHPLLAQGGVAGTIEEWYPNTQDAENPYIFGKTGTLANNHQLAGYLIAQSQKKYIFCIMNNHFILPSSEVKKEMEKLLNFIKTNF